MNRFAVLTVLITGIITMTSPADEGMWLLNEPPRAHLKTKYAFDLTDEWLDRARNAAVRFNNGGSGGFVSADGLIVTNHHIGADSVQKLSTASRDLYRDGFYAATQAEELKCPDLELNVLRSIEDVTARVQAAVKEGMSPTEAVAARRKVTSEIEKESLDKTGLRSEVVILYNGAAYHLYRYQKYTDVRLVFAPEHAIAFFGGDRDNFEYPRFNLDVAFFRAYEDGKPVRPKHFFRWSADGPKADDLVFVLGNPGTTQRLETSDKLIHRRDLTLPYALERLRGMEAALEAYGQRGAEQVRQAATDVHRYANARKAFAGQLEGLKKPGVLERKLADEKTNAEKVDDVTLAVFVEYKRAFNRIRDVLKVWATFEKEYGLLERGDAYPSELFMFARHLVRLRDELKKENTERLKEYRESNLESLKFQLFSPAPVYRDLERVKMEEGLRLLVKTLGEKHELTTLILEGKTPAQRAEELVAATKLTDSAARRAIYDGSDDLAKSDDPMIRFALRVDEAARKLRQRFETEVDEPEKQAYPGIAGLRFARFGRDVAPDATFTLRLAFGVVKGYAVDGENLPFHTTVAGLFERSAKEGGKGDFALPQRWLKGKAKLPGETPFNFVSTADTIGGNSGSPVVNRAGELVGINFDRNRHGLVRNFVYTDEQARHIAVHSRGVLDALKALYDCPALVKELTGRE